MQAMRAMVLTLSLSALILLFLTAGLSGGGRVSRPVEVVVAPGDTLWSIAVRTAPEADPRQTVDEIMALNHLATSWIAPGQRLFVKERR